MGKPKSDFQRAAEKIKLLSGRATVVQILFAETANLSTPDVQQDFLRFLDSRALPHEILFQRGSDLTFAVPHGKHSEINTLTHEFFDQVGRQNGYKLINTETNMDYDTLARLRNAVLKPFSPTRREVDKMVARVSKPGTKQPEQRSFGGKLTNDFEAAKKKTILFYNQAAVVKMTFSLRKSAADIGRDLFQFLDSRALRYEPIFMDRERLVFAVAREKQEAVRTLAREFFSQENHKDDFPGIDMLSRPKEERSYDPFDLLCDAVEGIFNKTTRDVNKALRQFKAG
jgi:hypothetical protein